MPPIEMIDQQQQPKPGVWWGWYVFGAAAVATGGYFLYKHYGVSEEARRQRELDRLRLLLGISEDESRQLGAGSRKAKAKKKKKETGR